MRNHVKNTKQTAPADTDRLRRRKKRIRASLSFVIMAVLLIGMFFLAVNTGS